MATNYESLMQTISEVAQAERITKQGLSILSRDILVYMLEEEDIRPVNALLGTGTDGKFILTPINWRIAVQYFHHFLPFSSNYDDVKEYAVKGTGNRTALVFGKKSKKRWDKCVALIEEWLADENNDVWVWSNNAQIDAKPVDYAKKITQAVQAATDEEKGNMSLLEVLSAVTEVEGVSIHDVMAALDHMTVPEGEEHAEAA